jgi:hypothetical protein
MNRFQEFFSNRFEFPELELGFGNPQPHHLLSSLGFFCGETIDFFSLMVVIWLVV